MHHSNLKRPWFQSRLARLGYEPQAAGTMPFPGPSTPEAAPPIPDENVGRSPAPSANSPVCVKSDRKGMGRELGACDLELRRLSSNNTPSQLKRKPPPKLPPSPPFMCFKTPATETSRATFRMQLRPVSLRAIACLLRDTDGTV